jgi:hypothetical protein
MRLASVVPLFLAVFTAQADVTLRYKSQIQVNPSLPPELSQQMSKGLSGMLAPETALTVRGDKGFSSLSGVRCVVDFKTQQITVMDPVRKRYSTMSSERYGEEISKVLADLPEGAKAAMAMMKISSEVKTTGRSATIQDIEADEREITLTIEGPALPNLPPGPFVKMTIRIWTPKPGQEDRLPALRELLQYKLGSYQAMNGASILTGMFQQMPGVGDGLAKLAKDMQSSNAIALRTQASMWMPWVGAMLKQLPADKNPLGADFDPDATILEWSQELAEISTAPVADSIFAIPGDYTQAPPADFVRSMMPKTAPPAQQ